VIPQAKLPNITLPTIRSIPSIPHVGSAGASGTTYIGEQFGNLPDLHAVLHIKTLKKALEEQIYALIQGKLPDPARPIPYDARALQLVDEVAELASSLNDVVAGVMAEVNAAIDFVNGKIAEVNAAKAAIESVPQGARDAVQQLMLQRHDRYAHELTAQAGRLESTIESIGS